MSNKLNYNANYANGQNLALARKQVAAARAVNPNYEETRVNGVPVRDYFAGRTNQVDYKRIIKNSVKGLGEAFKTATYLNLSALQLVTRPMTIDGRRHGKLGNLARAVTGGAIGTVLVNLL